MRVLLLSILLITSMTAIAEYDDAKAITISWLEIVDSGGYSQSWEQAAEYFQKSITSKKWEQALDKVRKPLGGVLSRSVKQLTKHESLPNSPKGQYTVLTLATDYERKKSATETVTLQKINNGWQVVGYFIR